MKAFLLGAGASRGTFDTFRVPVAAEFGETLTALDPCWTQNYPALLAAVEHLSLDTTMWSLEPVWSCMDYYAKLHSALPRPKPWEGESKQMKKALLAVYGRRCDEAADRVAEDSTLAQLFRNELQAGDVVISFNYDTITERIVRKWAPQLCLRGVPRGGSEDVILAKPHGSTSWTLDLASRSLTWLSLDGSPLLTSLSASDVDCKREPLLLGAVPIKSELIKEVQEFCGVPSVFDTIRDQWRAVVEAVRDAETIFVVGYSFPSEDQYGRFLLQEGLRLRTGKLRIEFFELEDKQAWGAREIASVFGSHIHALVFRGPAKPGRSRAPR